MRYSKKELDALRDQAFKDIREATRKIGEAGCTVTVDEVRDLMNLVMARDNLRILARQKCTCTGLSHSNECPEWELPY